MICRQPSSNNKPVSGIRPLAGCSLLAAAGWLFLMLAATAPALAQDVTFSPKFLNTAHWTVGPIEGNKEDGRKFCSTKAGFGTALTFVFARDSGGAQSLAFEFPAKQFSAGATVPVLLAVGEVQYPLNALAATNRILLIGLARGGEIEMAMLQNKPVHLQFAQQQYLLSLAGFAASVAEVDQCLAVLSKGESFATAKVDADSASEKFQTITPAVKRETTRVRNVTPAEIESFNPSVAAQTAVLQDEIRRLRRENQKLLIEKQAAESQLLATTIDTAAGEEEGGAPAQTAASAMPAMPPYIMRADKQVMWQPSKAFADIVATYMTTEAARCPADFAQTPGTAYKQADGSPVQEIETACLGMPKKAGEELSGDYAGALLFVGREGKIDVIVHQGPAGMIEQALQARQAAMRQMGIQKSQ